MAAQSPDLAPFGTVTASASQNDQDGTFPAGNAIDGDPATRWASGNGPDDATSVFTAWLQVDLGTSAQVDRVGLLWEAAYAVKYTVQVAQENPQNDESWTTISAVDTGDGGLDEIVPAAPVTARYLRVTMLERFSNWPWGSHWYGYSLYSLEINGVAAATSVGFSVAAQATPAGQDAVIQVRLNQAAAQAAPPWPAPTTRPSTSG
jgi:beta-glucosidase